MRCPRMLQRYRHFATKPCVLRRLRLCCMTRLRPNLGCGIVPPHCFRPNGHHSDEVLYDTPHATAFPSLRRTTVWNHPAAASVYSWGGSGIPHWSCSMHPQETAQPSLRRSTQKIVFDQKLSITYFVGLKRFPKEMVKGLFYFFSKCILFE